MVSAIFLFPVWSEMDVGSHFAQKARITSRRCQPAAQSAMGRQLTTTAQTGSGSLLTRCSFGRPEMAYRVLDTTNSITLSVGAIHLCRHTCLLSAARTQTEFARRAFSVAAPHTRNSLPSDIRSCHTLHTFKKHLFRQS